MAPPLTVFPLRLLAKSELDLEVFDGSPSHKLLHLVKSLKPTLRCLLMAENLHRDELSDHTLIFFGNLENSGLITT